MSDDLVALAAACRANQVTLAGPVPAAEAAAHVVACTDGTVALPVGDALVDACGLGAALGARALTPDDAAWGERIASAAVGVTGSVVVAAETGTVVVATAPGHPRSLTLVPPHHVCLVREDAVVAGLEAAFDRLPDPLPSDLHWVSGPSRTGDLEMISTIGIHGPLEVTFLLVAR